MIVLDNCKPHPKTLQDLDHRIYVHFLSPNKTALIQSMDQHVIRYFKEQYKRLFYVQLVDYIKIHETQQNPFGIFFNMHNLYHAVKNTAKAWEKVEPKTLEAFWRVHGS